MSAVVHIAGIDVMVGNQKRQRCAWCGAVLLDYDLERIAAVVNKDEEWSGPAFWAIGSLVAVDGHMSYVVDHEDGAKLPEGSCGLLSHDVTGARGE